jgi:hypothetical protein
VATAAFGEQHQLLLNLIRHCLPQIPSSLLAECIISRGVYEFTCNENKGPSERGVALLDCIRSRIEAVPSDFAKIIKILEAEPFLKSQANALIKSYCKCEQKGWRLEVVMHDNVDCWAVMTSTVRALLNVG